MHGILLIVRTAFRSLSKTPSVPFLWLAVPLALATIFYFAFGQIGSTGGSGPPRGTLLVVDHDASIVSGLLKTALTQEPMSNFFVTEALDDTTRIRKRYEELKAAAALVVPDGFQDSLLAGVPVDLAFSRNPRMTFSPQMAAAALQTFLDIGNRLLRELEPILDEFKAAENETDSQASFTKISQAFYDVGQKLSGELDALANLGDLDVAVQRPASEKQESFASSTDFFAAFLPGLLLFGLLFVGDGFERRFVHEREGVLLRASTSPLRHVEVMLAQALVVVVGTLVCATLVLGLGSLLFRVSLRDPGLLLLIVLGFSLFITGLFKTMYARAKSEQSMAAVSTVVILLMSLIGGGFVPVEVFPEGLQKISGLTPFGGASRGMVNVLLRGEGLSQIAPYVVRTWMWGVGLCVIGFTLAGRTRRSA